MKVAIDCGHNCPPDTGCSGVIQEDVGTKEVGEKLYKILVDKGHHVWNVTPKHAYSVTDSLRQRCNAANKLDVDLYVSIHFNCFNGSARGTEVYAISEEGKRYANEVHTRLVLLGFANRGVKNGSHLYVLKNTNAPAILVEVCFCDSKVDMAKYDANKVAHAIAEGIDILASH